MRVPAVVGSWPEPFVHGFQRNRWPAAVDCRAAMALCQTRVTSASPRPALEKAALRANAIAVVVGPWATIRHDHAAALLSQAPDRSGVFARFVGAKKPLLELLNQRGAARRQHRQGRRAGRRAPAGGRAADLGRDRNGQQGRRRRRQPARGAASQSLRRRRPSPVPGRSGCRSREARARLHAGPQPAASGLAGRRDRVPGRAGGRRLHLLEPAGPGRRRARDRARGLRGGSRSSRPGLAAAGAAAPALHGGRQRPGQPPGRDGAGARLGDAGARQHRRHARVPGGGCVRSACGWWRSCSSSPSTRPASTPTACCACCARSPAARR